MPVNEVPRSRLSIDLPEDLHQSLNKLLGGWRIKRALYEKITVDIVNLLQKIDEGQRRNFIVAILDDYLTIEDYSKDIKEAIK